MPKLTKVPSFLLFCHGGEDFSSVLFNQCVIDLVPNAIIGAFKKAIPPSSLKQVFSINQHLDLKDTVVKDVPAVEASALYCPNQNKSGGRTFPDERPSWSEKPHLGYMDVAPWC